MAPVTYKNQTPDNIRYGDIVIDHLGREYEAYSDAIKDQWNQWNVKTRDGRLYAYEMTDLVTITYVEATEYDYV